jgi:hypothetical protein
VPELSVAANTDERYDHLEIAMVPRAKIALDDGRGTGYLNLLSCYPLARSPRQADVRVIVPVVPELKATIASGERDNDLKVAVPVLSKITLD